MSFAPTSPITGADITGLTSPTYTHTADTPPAATAKQFAVTAVGGTQDGVSVHSISSPFTMTMFRPANFKVLGKPNAAGVIRSFPNNRFEVLTRKGVGVLANQPIQLATVRTVISIPAGSDVYDAVSIKAMLSSHIGLLTQIPQGTSDTVLTGTL
jgi:hypothetical protein